MRDFAALLNPLVNIEQPHCFLASEVEAAQRLVTPARQRTALQRIKQRGATERAAQINRFSINISMVLMLNYGVVDLPRPAAPSASAAARAATIIRSHKLPTLT
jgi:hypothetical protein